MLIISQNLAKYSLPFPKGTIYRINLAWINSIDELTKILKRHSNHPIFLDLPAGRIKPPNNKYSLDDLIPIIKSNKQIKYFAVSNVESDKNLTEYLETLPQNIILVPKIENAKGIENIQDITNSLPGQKIVMLDHDDLFQSLERNGISTSKFRDYINDLVEFCEKNDIILLRTRGVIFSDEF